MTDKYKSREFITLYFTRVYKYLSKILEKLYFLLATKVENCIIPK
jgi:hypothetical protein